MTPENPVVSVILPVYNGENTLQTAVDSVLGQSFRQFELIIIDDGSEDSSIEKIRELDDPRIKKIYRDHQGLASCLNHGLSHSSGKYIARMDADDISMMDRFLHQVHFLDENPDADLVATNVLFKGSLNSEGIRHYITWQNQLLHPDDIYLSRFVDSPVVHPSIMARKSAFEEFGNYSEKDEPEDFELWLRWMNKGARFYKLQDPLLIWTDYPTRLTRIHRNYDKDNFFRVKAKYFSKWYSRYFKIDEYPDIWIIGFGRQIFRRTSFLEENGLKIKGFVDFKKRPFSKRKVVTYEELTSLENAFFLSYVNDRKGKVEVHEFLMNARLKEGQDFYMMA